LILKVIPVITKLLVTNFSCHLFNILIQSVENNKQGDKWEHTVLGVHCPWGCSSTLWNYKIAF